MKKGLKCLLYLCLSILFFSQIKTVSAEYYCGDSSKSGYTHATEVTDFNVKYACVKIGVISCDNLITSCTLKGGEWESHGDKVSADGSTFGDGKCGICNEKSGYESWYYCHYDDPNELGVCKGPELFTSQTDCETKHDKCLDRCPDGVDVATTRCMPVSSDPGDPITVEPEIIDLTPDQLENINPLRDSSVFKEDRSPANVINQTLNRVIFPLAGSILFLLLVYGGFQIISASLSGKQNYIDIGKQRITAAIIGFILLFVSYWLWRLVMLVFGIAS